MNHYGLLIKLMKRNIPRKSVIVRKLACHWYDVCKVAQCMVQVVSLKLWYSAGWGVSLRICHIHRQFGRKGSGIWLWVLPAQYLH